MSFFSALAEIVNLLEADQFGRNLNEHYSTLVVATSLDVEPARFVNLLRRLCKCADRHLGSKHEEPLKKVVALYEKLILAIELVVKEPLELLSIARSFNDTCTSLCLHLLILSGIAKAVDLETVLLAINHHLLNCRDLLTPQSPWLTGALNSLLPFPFESAAALVSFLGLYQTLWSWTVSPVGKEFFLSLKIHSLLPLFGSPHDPLYTSRMLEIVNSCSAPGACGFHPLKRRALICFCLAGGQPSLVAHRKFWLRLCPASVLARIPGWRDAGLAEVVRERRSLLDLGLGGLANEKTLREWMKDPGNFEMAFKFFAISYLDKVDFDLKLLRGLLVFAETQKLEAAAFRRIAGLLAAEAGRRRDTFDFAKLRIEIEPSPQLSLAMLDLKEDGGVGVLREVLGDLEKESMEFTPSKRKRLSDSIRSVISKFGICIYSVFG